MKFDSIVKDRERLRVLIENIKNFVGVIGVVIINKYYNVEKFVVIIEFKDGV